MRARTIITLALTYALLGLLMNSVGIVILQSIVHFGASKLMGSTLEACKDLSVVVASFLLVGAVPAFGYRRSLIAILAVMAFVCLLASFATGFPAMQALFVMTGLAFGITKIATYSAIGLVARDPADHASITGLVEGVFMVGVLAGAWIFGWFIDSGDWLRVYWLLAAFCALASFAWIGIRLDESAASTRGDGASASAGWKEMLALAALPATVAVLATLFLYVLIEQGVGTWLPTFNREILHLPAAMSVQMSSIFIASLALGRLLSGLLLRRIAWLPVLLTCLAALAALVVLALPLAEGVRPRADTGWANAPFAAYLFPLIGLFLAPVYPTICSVALSALPQHRHAAMIGLIVIFSALGGTIGSFLVGLLFQSVPGTTAFYFLLAPMALVALALPLVRRRVASMAR
ncbi:MFS transporter [Sphingopyxis lindanitolerans]|nr:MFS transporter [Sphingopyxis lindanitolerans]